MSARWPDLAVLELLLATAEHGSLGAGARSVGMAQPNASRALARLEHELGLALIRRAPRGSTLTAHGALVVQWARAVLDAAGQLVEGATALRAEQDVQINIGASMTVAEYLLPAWLGEFRRQQPDTRVHLQVHNSHDVFAGIRQGSFNVGFVESPGVPRDLRSAVVAHDRLVVVVDPGHPWARRRTPLTVTELAATPLVVREPGSGTRITLAALLDAYHPVAPVLELNSNAAVRVSVTAGVAPAVLSVLAVEAALRTGELRAVPVDGLDLRRQLRAVWLAPGRLKGPAGRLVQIAGGTAHRVPE
ncbi:LysR substrate-binding domain-containing protein [Micromonospora sp. NPDC047548]|uniref:LysR substrate-binding domain-containing protein n=1 Tax=Micromonospora sp. NPDC047548 TaxID=3155624 RepID=UPI0033DA6D65